MYRSSTTSALVSSLSASTTNGCESSSLPSEAIEPDHAQAVIWHCVLVVPSQKSGTRINEPVPLVCDPLKTESCRSNVLLSMRVINHDPFAFTPATSLKVVRSPVWYPCPVCATRIEPLRCQSAPRQQGPSKSASAVRGGKVPRMRGQRLITGWSKPAPRCLRLRGSGSVSMSVAVFAPSIESAKLQISVLVMAQKENPAAPARERRGRGLYHHWKREGLRERIGQRPDLRVRRGVIADRPGDDNPSVLRERVTSGCQRQRCPFRRPPPSSIAERRGTSAGKRHRQSPRRRGIRVKVPIAREGRRQESP